jgi:opacity protein-like surface antigen
LLSNLELSEEIKVKYLQITLILATIAIALMCSGFVAALNANEASVQTFLSSQIVQPGQTITVTVIFNNSSPDALQVTNLGVHFDWMESTGFFGFDLTHAPVNIPIDGNYVFSAITVQIPTNVTIGQHTYTIGVDGTQGSSTAPFSWDSPTSIIEVTGNGQTTAPTPTSTNSGDGQPEGQPNFLLYGAIGAIVIIIALLIIVLVMKQKRTKPKPKTNQDTTQPKTPMPEQKPESGQDFNI